MSNPTEESTTHYVVWTEIHDVPNTVVTRTLRASYPFRESAHLALSVLRSNEPDSIHGIIEMPYNPDPTKIDQTIKIPIGGSTATQTRYISTSNCYQAGTISRPSFPLQ